MIKIFKNTKGETIAETIIALSILAIGITLSTTLMGNSLRNINVSKSRVIAVNIAREGIEAVRNIRDTNWLKYSSKRRICWNNMPALNVESECSGNTLINSGDYIVYKDENHQWRLKAIANDDNYIEENLYKVDIDLTVDTDKDGDNENDTDMYNHIPTNNNSDALGDDYAVNTNFRRVIKISYLKDNGGVGDSSNNRMVVTSTVTWFKGEVEHSVVLKTHLTDYLGRDNLSS